MLSVTNRFWIVGMAVLLGAAFTFGAEPEQEPPAELSEGLWFPVGEELVYQLKWGMVPIGRSTVRSDWVSKDGQWLIRIRYRTFTNRVFDKIYPMDDAAQSLIDPATFLPVEFRFMRKRRRKTCDDVVTFDYAAGEATTRQACSGMTKTFRIGPEMRDVMTFLYFMRRDNIPTERKKHKVVANDGVIDLDLGASGQREVRVDGIGKVNCTTVVPIADWGGVLVEDGELTSLVSRDSRRIAVQMIIKAPVANVRATLCAVAGPGEDAWVTKMRRPKGDECGCATEDAE